MTARSSVPAWRRYLHFWRHDVQADIDAELRFHIEARVEELIVQGGSPDVARAQAIEELGDVGEVRRDLRAIDDRIVRRRDRVVWLRSLAADFSYSARSLARTPVVAATIVITLALGLGVNAAMFSLLDVLYLRPPAGVPDPGSVNRVWYSRPFESGAQYWPGFDYPSYRAMRQALEGHAATAIYSVPQQQTIGGEAHDASAQVSWVSSEFFSVLGVRAARGRMYAKDEDRLGAPADVAVISDAYWHRAFGGDARAIGRTITVRKDRYTIIGIAPAGFAGVELDATDVWLPFSTFVRSGSMYFDPQNATPWWENRNINAFQVLVRPRTGANTAALDARITAALHRPELLYRPSDTANVARLGSIIRARGPGKTDQEFRIATRLGGVAAIVLFIAIANVVNLLLARAVRRRREIAVRLALGISRARLVRLLVSESVLLSLIAGVAAVLAAWWGGALLRALLLPDIHWAATPMHWRVLLFSIAIALGAGVVAGLLPALQSSSPDLSDALKAGAREGAVRRSRLRGSLVVAQAALSMVLLVGATLFLRSLANVRARDIGYDSSRLLFAEVTYDQPDSTRDAYLTRELRELAQRLQAAAGVSSVALTNSRPMYSFSFTAIYPDADTATVSARHAFPTFAVVSPGYFKTVGMRLLRGRGFAAHPEPSTLIINQAMAHAYWPGEDALGRCIRLGKPDAPCFTVIGVVQTAARSQIIEDPRAQFYLPMGRVPFTGYEPRTLVVRADPGAHATLSREIRRMVSDVLPGTTIDIVRMSDALEPQYRPWKLGAVLFTLFGLLALFVAAVGIYSSVSYAVSQRVHEIGVRMALGATRRDVVRQVIGSGLRTVVIGVGAGVALAIAAGHLVAALLYGVRPSDVESMVAVSVVLLAVAVAAALIPAWRASRVDPVTALRVE
ncbi:MAG TPA: ADOP family duplicated permease [Gemmatimonadaceae bacterium]|nr:ADOP family duplicated permease [Gemmatimonadaceae bacterium]